MSKYLGDDRCFQATAGEDIAVCDAVSISAPNGLARRACAGAGIEEMGCVGFAETACAEGEIVSIKFIGKIMRTTVDLFPGAPVYLGNLPGTISPTTGDTTQIVGIAVPELEMANIQGLSPCNKFTICLDQIAADTQQSSSSSSSSTSSSSSSSTSSSSSSSSA